MYPKSWRKFAYNFGLNYSYAENIILEFIATTKNTFVTEYIHWISVNDRITKYNLRKIDDYPTLLVSIDATVQRKHNIFKEL